jgi:branched-chain amino acid aminotransferase
MKEPLIYVNGAFVLESEARISVLDHAVLYGDGVFDTVVAWNGRIFKLEAHIDRFFRSMQAIALPSPVTRDELRAIVIEAVRRNGEANAYVKWIMTRGHNGTPLMDPTGCVPNLIVITRPYIHRFTDGRGASGIRVKTAAIRRPPGQVLDAHVKSLNYLNLILAKIEAKAAGVDEALLLDIHGRVCEAPGYNVFVVRGGHLFTPDHDILAGITREAVMELAARRQMPVVARDLELYDAHTADEVFFCSTAGGLIPVVEIDGRRIGDGAPGPVYQVLARDYRDLLASGQHGTPVFETQDVGAR